MTREQFEGQLERVPSIEGRNVWIWGAGNVALQSQETIKRTGLKVCGYCDSDEKKRGGYLKGSQLSHRNICWGRKIFVCSSA